ncbi:MAG: hypothetical protein V5A39_01420 [Haloarculaceae archaeon]
MVEDRVNDGERIAQLLASELTGLETGPLAEVAVTDADPDVEPSPDGPIAYAVEYRGTRIGSVSVYPEHARLRLDADIDDVEGTDAPVPVERPDDVTIALPLESGAAVKRGVDALRAVLAPQG